MMKEIKAFQTGDGKVFTDRREAGLWELALEDVKGIESMLPLEPEYKHWRQHNREILNKALAKLHQAASAFHNISYPLDSYGFARTLDDSDSPFGHLYFRLVSCMDLSMRREYCQPFYKAHPGEAVGEDVG